MIHIFTFNHHHFDRGTVNPYAAGGQFGQYYMMQKTIETMAHGYSSESTYRELSNEYQYARV